MKKKQIIYLIIAIILMLVPILLFYLETIPLKSYWTTILVFYEIILVLIIKSIIKPKVKIKNG